MAGKVQTPDIHESMEISYPPMSSSATTPAPSMRGSLSTQEQLVFQRDEPQQQEIAALPDPDKGYAWIFLAAATTIELVLWGYGLSVGQLHQYWIEELFPDGSSAILALAATLQSGLIYISTTLATPIFGRYPHHRASLMYGGLALAILGIFASAFATKPWHLVLTSGFLYPIGAGFVYVSPCVLLFEWFAQKRGLASGVLNGGTGLGGTVLPYIMSSLLQKYSYKAAIISLALSFAVLGVPAVYFIRERVPVTRPGRNLASNRRPRGTGLPFLKRPSFYAFTLTVLFTSLANYAPSVWINVYATAIGLSNAQGTLMLTLMNGTSVVGLFVFGFLSDRWPLRVVILLSCLGAAASSFLLWGFANSAAVLVAFSICWGIFGLSFTALWTQMISLVAGKDDPTLPRKVFGIFMFARGIGAVTSGPISNALLSQGHLLDIRRRVYGVEGFGPLLLYCGVMLTMGGISGASYKE